MQRTEQRYSSGKPNPGEKGSGSRRFIKRGKKEPVLSDEKDYTTLFVAVGIIVLTLIILILYGHSN